MGAFSPDLHTPLLSPICAPHVWPADAGSQTDNAAASGTIFSSAMNLSACALGASMLSLPYTMQIAGPIAALEALLFFAIMAFFSAQAVVSAGLQCRKSSYADIVCFYFGPVFGLISNILLSVALLVAAISYIVGLADLLPDMLPFTAYLSRPERIFCTVAVLYPATLVSNLASFGPASFIAAAGCYLQAIALVTQLVFTSDSTSWSSPPQTEWTKFHPDGMLYSLPMICFVYAFHYVLTETLCELSNPTPVRMALVNVSAVCIMLCCYLPVAVAGYLAHSGRDLGPNLLAGFGKTSATVLVAKWSIGGLLLITYALFIIPLRKKIEAIVCESGTTGMGDLKRMGIVAGLNCFVAVSSVCLSDLGIANTIAGGCTALIMFYFPGRLMVAIQMERVCEERDAVRLGVGRLFIVIGLVVCVVGLFGGAMFDF